MQDDVTKGQATGGVIGSGVAPTPLEPGVDHLTERVRALLHPPSDTDIQALKVQYPNATLHQLTTPAGFSVVVLTPVPPHAYNRFRRHSVGNDDKKAQAVELFFRDVVVFPAAPSINEALKLKAGLGETFGQKVLKLAGLEEDTDVEGKAL